MAENADEDSSTGIDLICALCDNGGEIASCEGKCLRSFHATKDAGEDCKTLGYTRDQFDAMKVFLCKNCEHQTYQCFACQRLGSAKTDPPEVFPCASASCGHFYHAKCVAQLLFPENEAKATEYTTRIINGAKFACPVHRCDVCKYGENKEVSELQFAVCRRCPKSYHRRCLPRNIAFDDIIENGICILQRAWDGLLPNNPTKKKVPPVFGGTKRQSDRPLFGEKAFTQVIPISSFPEVDINTARRIYEFAQEASSDITIEDVQKNLVVSSTYTSYMKNTEKVTLGKVERSVEAVKTAVHMLENGAAIESAKAFCAPYELFQISKWKNKLNIYLAPFLHGMRYTSYGRHFTKLDKLEKIVDKLQWYIQSGDTVVDFCCGSNDFSTLLKEKLEDSEKHCFYKNYDLIQPKNNFNFERRDWMTVQPDELPAGSRLIMGLNPPFGFKASLANQFINKALSFKPKLIILIVPKETERLDKKYPPYELIWEDCNQLSGKSFYLPGSLDADNKQMDQWNLSPPPLSLWSRSDYAQKHHEIAKSMGHQCSRKPCSGDSQRDIAGIASMSTTGDLEMGNEGESYIHDEEMQGDGPVKASVIDQLMLDTYHDTTSSPGDYWTDTNGRSGQPCNYDVPGRSDPPIHEYLAERATDSDMSISLSGTSDSGRENQTVSTSDDVPTNPRACHHIGSVSAEQPIDPADSDEVTSADVHHNGLGEADSAPGAGLQYQILEDSPPEEGELTDSLPADRHAAGVPRLIMC
ncbi:protein ENHANCED DOWNY MILDEW 2-like [Lolium rigidum]|uniref:protein ENHANCED DOWNY MILDEW 2-like n=1 Tax=Lolium rigidum TaxID=89674 RepID=UPI001F5C147E|nr:protein ENHANCED DOWNY MILDEW 2-like [Lolium rigidum]